MNPCDYVRKDLYMCQLSGIEGLRELYGFYSAPILVTHITHPGSELAWIDMNLEFQGLIVVDPELIKIVDSIFFTYRKEMKSA